MATDKWKCTEILSFLFRENSNNQVKKKSPPYYNQQRRGQSGTPPSSFQPWVKDPISSRVRARGAVTAAPMAPDAGPSAASRWAGGVVAIRWDVKGWMSTQRGCSWIYSPAGILFCLPIVPSAAWRDKDEEQRDVDDRGHLFSFQSLVKFSCCSSFCLRVSRVALRNPKVLSSMIF